MKKNPSLPAMVGLVSLWLTPFSVLKNMQIFTIAVMLVSLYRLIVLRPFRIHRSGNAFEISQIRKIRIYLLATVLYVISVSLISLLVLFSSGESEYFQWAWRFFTQLGALFVYMFLIICGYHLAMYFDTCRIRQAIFIPFTLMLLICVYQVFAESYGLPYIGHYVLDKFVGLRPSGLAAEPKYLATYLAVVLFFLLFELSAKKEGQRKLDLFIKLGGAILATYFIVVAASGNGFLAVIILMAVYFARLSLGWKLAIGITISSILIWLWTQIETGGLGMRGTHQDILDNIGNLDLTLFDDLIALPLMAWRDNIFNLLIGFGPGLMHFFAYQYIGYATWVTDETYIEGNLSAITFISNFGLILFMYLFLLFIKRSYITINNQTLLGVNSPNSYFVNAFFVGALVQGNSSIPFYLSLGWILHWSVRQKYNKEAVQYGTHD